MAKHGLVSRGRVRGFTLIELLVSMAIIAILVTVLATAATAAIRTGQQSKCASNLRNISAALLTFAGDNDGKFPQTSNKSPFGITAGDTDPTTGLASWMIQLDPYDGGSRDTFKCPANPGKTAPNDYFLAEWAAYYAGGQVYPAPPLALAKVKNASTQILVGDSAVPTGNDADRDDGGPGVNPAFGGGASNLHNKYVNLAFMDGHVSAFKSFDSTQMSNRYDGPHYTYGSASPTPDAP